MKLQVHPDSAWEVQGIWEREKLSESERDDGEAMVR